jgi:hypothetical protein
MLILTKFNLQDFMPKQITKNNTTFDELYRLCGSIVECV